ncbi:MAG: EamA family transporter [Bacteroidetes bacterium]|nr:EamA family transporter [Bacteroidota bacterium]
MQRSISFLSWVILIVLSLVWGSSFILMKEGLKAFTSDEVAAIRISMASLVLLPFVYKYRGISFQKTWKGLVLMGVFGSLLPAFLFTKAETRISSSLTGMLNALTPLFTIILGRLLFGQHFSRNKFIGVAIGFIGAVCLILFGDDSEDSSNILYSLLVVLATLFYALSVNGIKAFLSDTDSMAATVWSFMLTGPVAAVYLFSSTDFTTHLTRQPHGWASFGFVSILGIVGSAISVVIYNTLIKQAGVVFAASCTYLIPVVAIGWGLYDGETVHSLQFVAIGVIILGIWLINRK